MIGEEVHHLGVRSVDQDLQGVVGVDDRGVDVGVEVDRRERRVGEVVLHEALSVGILEPENEMHFVGAPAFVRAEHDRVRRALIEIDRPPSVSLQRCWTQI